MVPDGAAAGGLYGGVVEARATWAATEVRVPGCRDRAVAGPDVHFGQRGCSQPCHGLIRGTDLVLQAGAYLLGLTVVGELGQRLDGLDADLALRPLQHRQDGIDVLWLAELAERAHDDGQCLGIARLQHFEQPGHRTLAADFGERIDGAFADPPVIVAGGLDQVVYGPLILGLVQNLDGRAPDILVLLLYQLQHSVDDPGAADLAQRIRRAAAHPPVAVLERLQQVFDACRRCRPH